MNQRAFVLTALFLGVLIVLAGIMESAVARY
jgi:hypothetical protein